MARKQVQKQNDRETSPQDTLSQNTLSQNTDNTVLLETVLLDSVPNGVIVPVKAQPGARQNSIAGVRNGRLIVKCTQAPEKGKANDAIIEILAKLLHLRKSQITLVSGPTNSEKKFLIAEITETQLKEKLQLN